MRASQQRLMRRAKGDRRKQLVVEAAFDRFMDEAVARLVALGLTDLQAIDAIFEVATHCAQESLLPEFPEEREQFQQVGEWLVKAHDFGFVDFVVAALTHEEADVV